MRSTAFVGSHQTTPLDTRGATNSLDATALVTEASHGDHRSISELLGLVFAPEIQAEFEVQSECPEYVSHDRLIVRNGHSVVSHGRVTQHQMQFGSLELRAAWVSELATLPRFRTKGLGASVLEQLEHKIEQERADLAIAKTSNPVFFEERGWTSCFGPSYARVHPRRLLATFSSHMGNSTESPLDAFREVPSDVHVRLWRHLDLDSLCQIYDENRRGQYGPFERSDERWRWLLSLCGFNQIYLAYRMLDGVEHPTGYAISGHGRVPEINVRDQCQEAIQVLLARICLDTIESREGSIRIDVEPDSPVHAMCAEAEGTSYRGWDTSNETYLVRILDPCRFIHQLRPQLFQRARRFDDASFPTLGLAMDDDFTLRLEKRSRSVHIEHGKLGRSYLACDRDAITRLLLGQCDIEKEVEAGTIEASTQNAVRLAQRYFPMLPMWCPPFDG